MHSDSTHVPKLTITSCEFAYFFKYTSLVFVESYSFTRKDGVYVKQASDRGADI